MATHICRPVDPVWIASQRAVYVNAVRRAAEGAPHWRDGHWLHAAMRALGLGVLEYGNDLAAARSGDLAAAPRMHGEWPEMPTLLVQEIDSDV